jgi:hypothetical protein
MKNCLRCGKSLLHGYMAEMDKYTETCSADLWCGACKTGHKYHDGILIKVSPSPNNNRWLKIPEGCLAVEGDRVEL